MNSSALASYPFPGRLQIARLQKSTALLCCGAVFLAGFVTASPRLRWDYPEHGPEISFNVWASTNLSYWVKVGNTTNQCWPITFDKPAEFFHVTATNADFKTESK